jgi:hypothetical protein
MRNYPLLFKNCSAKLALKTIAPQEQQPAEGNTEKRNDCKGPSKRGTCQKGPKNSYPGCDKYGPPHKPKSGREAGDAGRFHPAFGMAGLAIKTVFAAAFALSEVHFSHLLPSLFAIPTPKGKKLLGEFSFR